ncbi:MAG: Cysteine rich repeat [Rhodospirillales bacterium]|nr:Cysteine rich repeat [Rhodospirillales bacterium]
MTLRLVAALLLITSVASAAEPQIPEARQAQLRAIADACRADAQKLCQATEPGEGRIITCLRARNSELSQACRTVLPQAPATPATPPKK